MNDEFGIRVNGNESYKNITKDELNEIIEEVKKINFNRYPDNDSIDIRKAYANVIGVSEENIIAGNGSDEMISLIIDTQITKRKTVLTINPDFSMYDFYTSLNDGIIKKYNTEKDGEFSVSKFITYGKKVEPKVIIFSNPNNPFQDIGIRKRNHLMFILLKELGIDIYRFSISWARLYPQGDELEPNKKGIAFYDHIFKEVHNAGMKIFLTMNHYAVPLYLVENYGGWTNRKLVTFYERFARTVFEHWGQYIDYFLPFNEINAGYFSPYNGVGLVKEKDKFYNQSLVFQSLHHQFIASAQTIKIARELSPKSQSGCMVACFCYYPLTSSVLLYSPILLISSIEFFLDKTGKLSNSNHATSEVSWLHFASPETTLPWK